MDKRPVEFYAKLAGILSVMSNKQKFEVGDIVKLNVDGEDVEVGPWKEATENWSEDVFWSASEEDEFCVFASQEKFDSWGQCYGNFGIQFRVAKKKQVIKYELEELYGVKIDYSNFQAGIEW